MPARHAGRRVRLGTGTLIPLAVVGALVLALTGAAASSAAAPATPAKQSIDEKVNALLAKMTLAEKFGQLEMAGPDGANGTPGPLLLAGAKNGTIGSVLDLVGVDNINAAQQAAMQSRLHIPLIFSLDVIHGYQTIFPVPLAEASTWDMAAISKDESVSASEATADGIKWTFNPMVDISRDPRWGRVVEGAGEDPYLGSAVAAAKVTRLPGQRLQPARPRWPRPSSTSLRTVPSRRGASTTRVDMSTQRLFNDYLPPYKAAIDAGAATVMSSFNSLNGVPATANQDLLTNDPAQDVRLPGHGGQRLPGRAGAGGVRLRQTTSRTPPSSRSRPASRSRWASRCRASTRPTPTSVRAW